MLRKTICMGLTLALAACFIGGCEPKIKGYQNPLDVAEARLPDNVKDNNYILSRMEFAELAMILNCYLRAEPYFEDARKQLDIEQSNVAAAVSSERHKYYKGETYERAFLMCNLGFISYYKGDYNNARIYFINAINEDHKAVVKKDTPAIYGDDFGLAYFWLGKAFLHMGDKDNARIALKKAERTSTRALGEIQQEQAEDRQIYGKMHKQRLEGEEWCWETFHNPKKPKLEVKGAADLSKIHETLIDMEKPLADVSADNPIEVKAAHRKEFFSPDFQEQTNLVMAFEVGTPPYKTLGGMQNEKTYIMRSSILPYYLRVYVDGHYLGPAYRVLDLWDQAETQDRVGAKEAAQVTKAVLKTIADQFISTGWDVSGDIRYWTLLPGRVFVSAARIKPGIHRITVKMYDIHGHLLPRMTNTLNGINVPESGELVVLDRPFFDCDNAISQEDREKAKKEGARPLGWKVYRQGYR